MSATFVKSYFQAFGLFDGRNVNESGWVGLRVKAHGSGLSRGKNDSGIFGQSRAEPKFRGKIEAWLEPYWVEAALFIIIIIIIIVVMQLRLQRQQLPAAYNGLLTLAIFGRATWVGSGSGCNLKMRLRSIEQHVQAIKSNWHPYSMDRKWFHVI